MGWKIEYDRRALKELKKLDRQAQQQILDYFDERIAPAQNPRQFGKSLSPSFSGLWRYRIGNYRAVCHIEDDKLIVLVLRIGHRGKVYKQPI